MRTLRLRAGLPGLTLLAVIFLGGRGSGAEPLSPPQEPPAAQNETNPQPASSETAAAPATSPLAAETTLNVMVGKSALISTPQRLKRVSVSDPGIADAVVVTPTQILVHGRAPGEVSLLTWDESERPHSFDVRVEVDISAAAAALKRIFPDQPIDVSASRSGLVLSGHVATEDVAKQAGAIAETYSKPIVNALSFGPSSSQEILLEVKFAEVDRSAVVQLGANFFSTGGANTIGTTTTGQFGAFSISRNTSTTGTTGSSGSTSSGGETQVNFSDALNLFLFRTDLNFGALVKALQSQNLLQILAEPNLIAVDGKEASFLAGGEFPFPIVQPGNGFTAVTIQFKEFGVRLKFTPLILPNGNIHLRVVPEVSQLDFTNALNISGFTVPALSTRRADTEFELKDGQSFVIAGLMNNQVSTINSKIPGLGDIPLLGNLFKSKNQTKSNAELMVLVTAHRISPSTQPPSLPQGPQPFLDKDRFDKKPSGSGK